MLLSRMNRLSFGLLTFLCILPVAAVLGDDNVELPRAENSQKPPQAERLFVTKVLPLLKSKCFACHGDDAKQLKGEFDMRTRKGLLAGGESGDPALVPGNADASPIFQAVNWDGLEMPPKQNDRLNDDQIAMIRQWIEAGAPWPDKASQQRILSGDWDDAAGRDGVLVKTSGGQTEEWTNRRYDPDDLWTLRPIRRPAVPREFLANTGDSNPIDAFIDREIAAAGLTPAPAADQLTLIRRATYDLTGLPPSPEEIEAFEAESIGNPRSAFRNVVDRLLASDHYGERMARHWLDVVRYADSAGFANDFARPNAWRYRDYVIRSFNQDKPYDKFIREQIAGDEIDPSNPENLIAVGFLRMGPWEHTGMSVAAVTRQQFLDDVTQSVGVTFLATEMRCCKCHDHKFDPLPQQDYYRMQAIFAPVQFADREVPFQSWENIDGVAEGKVRTERLLKDDGIRLVVPPEYTDEQREEAGLGVAKVKNKQNQIRRRALNMYSPLALSVYNGPPANYLSNRPLNPLPKSREGKAEEIFVLAGGSLESPRAKVTPGLLSAMSDFGYQPSDDRRAIPESMSGRRVALADWIANSKNPLTARVIVNRVWQWHFGKGIAANPNNFGKMGGKPTHPELLDWLASYFVEHGWSIKALHRLIMTSDVYQRSGAHRQMAKIEKADANNKLLTSFPPRRLSAEEIRDSMLAVSGELNPVLGGIPIRPEINLEIAMQPRHVMGSVAEAYQPSRTPRERNRRTIYALQIRTLRDPMLEVFDQPGSDTSCERRTSSTVTPQVFSLFNGQSSYDRALAMAARIEKAAKSTPDRTALAFRLAYGRAATAAEIESASRHVEKMTAHHRTHPPSIVEPPKTIVRTMVEEMTGLTFQWEEQLDIYQDYVPDPKPWDVGPETRALADLCLVLLNSNEFVYVY